MTLLANRQDASNFEGLLEASVGPPSSFAEVAGAAYESQVAQRNLFRMRLDSEALYDRRIDAIKAATGIEIMNPLRAGGVLRRHRAATEGLPDDLFAQWDADVRRLSEQFPDHRGIIRADETPLAPLLARMQATEKNSAEVMARRGASPTMLSGVPLVGGIADAGKYMVTDPAAAAASLFGTMRGMFSDPVEVPMNVLGMAVGAGSVGLGARQLLWGAVKNGAANAAVEAVQQPFVQGWRKKAGLESGVGHALDDIAGAFFLGGAIDAGARASYRGLRRSQGYTPKLNEAGGVERWRKPDGTPIEPDVRLDVAARESPTTSRVRQAADGDIDSLHQVAKELGVDQDPAYRGARKAAQLEDELGHQKPPAVEGGAIPEVAHLDTIIAHLRAAELDELPPVAPEPMRAHDPVALAALPEEARAARQRLEQDASLDVVAAADLMRRHPAIVDDRLSLLDPVIAGARDLSRLGDRAFEMVGAGAADPALAQVVARHVADPNAHASVLSDLGRAGVRTADEARQVLPDLVPREAPATHLAASSAGRRLLDNPDPRGAEVKAQIERLERDLAPQLKAAKNPEAAAKRAAEIRAAEDKLFAGGDVMSLPPEQRQRTIRAAADWEAIEKDLNAAARMLPRDVKLRVERELAIEGIGHVDGYYDPREQAVFVALAMGDPARTARHEVVHALRQTGLLDNAEFDTLYAFADRAGLRKAYDIDGKYKEPYTTLHGEKGEAHVEALLREETIAEMFADYRGGRRFGSEGGAIDRIIEAIVRFAERVRNGLEGRGFRSAADVFEVIESGDMAARPRGMVPAAVELPGGGSVHGVQLFALKAFHGTPHDFDKFSLDKIGTGEGAQVFGHGLYFAERESTARWYKNTLGSKKFFGTLSDGDAELFVDGVKVPNQHASGAYWLRGYSIDDAIRRVEKELGDLTKQAKSQAGLINSWRGDLSGAWPSTLGAIEFRKNSLADLKAWRTKSIEWKAPEVPPVMIDGNPVQFSLRTTRVLFSAYNGDIDRVLAEIRDAPKQYGDVIAELTPHAGKIAEAPLPTTSTLYEVSIKADVGDFIDWDSASAADRSALKRQEGVAAAMASGKKGVRYKDAMSRGKDGGTYNYVVFDDSLIEIVAKNGVRVNRLADDMADVERTGHLQESVEACQI